ncbi:nucleoside monophosphate kinase [Candidatus Parcubacteria bacterium]|jgi:adenylate kinase|nr:nucleoside monophosphate kinase [Candidatus Parcubacteria bacterium]
MKRIILIGPQASGKSTQGEFIAEHLGIKEVAAGDILRKAIENDTKLGKEIEHLVDAGALISDDLMIELMFQELEKKDYDNGFILDGFPRNATQLEIFEEKYDIDLVVHVDIPDSEAIKRISGRRICSNGHVFHIKFNPSKKDGICDECDHRLHLRDDDKETAVAKRLAIYHEHTEKVLEYYRKEGKVKTFDGNKDIKTVWKDIKEYLDKNVR